MAQATYRQKIDGKVYEVGDELPDYGSIKILESPQTQVIYGEGLSSDVAKLPMWVADGSKVLFTDTNEVYSKTDGTWRKMGG